jgi:hypothetical protein
MKRETKAELEHFKVRWFLLSLAKRLFAVTVEDDTKVVAVDAAQQNSVRNRWARRKGEGGG